MRNRLPLHALTLFLGLLNASFSLAQGAGPLVLEKEIALPGVEGRIDHFSVDVPNQRLFVAALENGSVRSMSSAAKGRWKFSGNVMRIITNRAAG
jgi:hypothetical protein